MNGGIRIFRNAAVALLAAMLIAGCAEKPEALVASAKELLAKNDRNAAVIQLRNALQKDPGLAEARFLLGKALYENGELPAAEKELRKASELNHPADEVIPALARVLVARGEFKKAIDEFGTVRITPGEGKADLQTTLAKARMSLGNTQAAGSGFAAALEAQPGFPPALVGEARLKAAAGDLPAAIALVDSALAKDPKLTEGWQLKGDLANAQQRRDDALAAYRKAVETKANYLPAHFMIVVMLLQDGKNDDAAKQLAAMKSAAPKHPQTYYLDALIAVRDKNFSAAREAIQLSIKGNPNSLLAQLLGAQIEYQLGSYAQAEGVLVAILQQIPSQTGARTLLVQTYLKERKPAKALDVLKPMLADESKLSSDGLALAGEVHMQNGDAAEAARYFEKAAALDPKNARKRTAAALSHLAKGEGERGMAELEAVSAEDTGIRADLALVATTMRQKKYDAAMAAVAAIEKKQPDSPLPHSLRGGVLAAKGDIAGARKSFERAVAVDPKYYPAAASLAQLDLRDKKPEEAKKRFETVLAKDPGNAQANLALAGMQARTGASTADVANQIGKAIAAKPGEVQPRLALISHYMRSKDYKKAVAAAQDAMAAIPDRPELLDAAGRAYRAAGETNQAAATYTKMAALMKDSPLPYMRLAALYIEANDNPAAVENVRKALAIKPDFVEAQRTLIALSVSGGRNNEALAAARDVQKRRPQESVGYLLEGQIHVTRKAWGEAETAYRNGLRVVPDSPDLAMSLHAVLGAGGKPGEADSLVASWLKDHPKDRAFRLYLGQTAIGKKDYAGAAKHYKAALELKPDDPFALNNLAWVSGQLKDPKAIEYAEKADKIAPNQPAILDTLGMLLVEKGDTARGVAALQRAVELAPNAGQVRLNYASALVKSGQKDAAKKELEAVAKLGGKYTAQAETAKQMLGL